MESDLAASDITNKSWKSANVFLGSGLGIEGNDRAVFALGDIANCWESAPDKIIDTLLNSDIGDPLSISSTWKASALRSGVVMAKTVCTPVKAAASEAESATSPSTTSTSPFAFNYCAFSELTSRVMARILYCLESSGSFSTWFRTELPCWPVAPKIARILAIVDV
ncbi:hypothetical protein N7449_011955 [Penicillium cf. viridicatum]|uniref:Uncharacterized protein n=1 Tax=Penicillium cf. viridicatum TaxID=2972119 RepID=A0A9W9LXQ6_9EURO|nr:hypothetical protein N7449_011955 [Penicillium cf. viridicatum]